MRISDMYPEKDQIHLNKTSIVVFIETFQIQVKYPFDRSSRANIFFFLSK